MVEKNLTGPILVSKMIIQTYLNIKLGLVRVGSNCPNCMLNEGRTIIRLRCKEWNSII